MSNNGSKNYKFGRVFNHIEIVDNCLVVNINKESFKIKESHKLLLFLGKVNDAINTKFNEINK